MFLSTDKIYLSAGKITLSTVKILLSAGKSGLSVEKMSLPVCLNNLSSDMTVLPADNFFMSAHNFVVTTDKLALSGHKTYLLDDRRRLSGRLLRHLVRCVRYDSAHYCRWPWHAVNLFRAQSAQSDGAHDGFAEDGFWFGDEMICAGRRVQRICAQNKNLKPA
jgi:hypothetical protein